MYINSERELEDYICEHIEDFINFLKSIYGENEDIEFVGRQIVIGDSRLDLLFQIVRISEDPYINFSKTFIVVELKFRKAEPKDIAQLSKYVNLLHNLEYDKRIGQTEVFVKGLLLTAGLGNEMQEIQMYLNNYTNANIKFVTIKTNLEYELDSYSRRDEYIRNMSVDKRLRETREEKEEKECGEKTNDRP